MFLLVSGGKSPRLCATTHVDRCSNAPQRLCVLLAPALCSVTTSIPAIIPAISPMLSSPAGFDG